MKVVYMLLVVIGLSYFAIDGVAQQRRVKKDPIQITDVLTGASIEKVLVLPLYSSASGVFIAPEGPAKGSVGYYLKNPFIYRAGEPFLPNRPPIFTGLPLFMVFVGKARETRGMMFIAPGYRPYLYDDLFWYAKTSDDKRSVQMMPFSNDEEQTQLLKANLSFLFDKNIQTSENCAMWKIEDTCELEINYDKKDRKMINDFLKISAKKND